MSDHYDRESDSESPKKSQPTSSTPAAQPKKQFQAAAGQGSIMTFFGKKAASSNPVVSEAKKPKLSSPAIEKNKIPTPKPSPFKLAEPPVELVKPAKKIDSSPIKPTQAPAPAPALALASPVKSRVEIPISSTSPVAKPKQPAEKKSEPEPVQKSVAKPKEAQPKAAAKKSAVIDDDDIELDDENEEFSASKKNNKNEDEDEEADESDAESEVLKNASSLLQGSMDDFVESENSGPRTYGHPRYDPLEDAGWKAGQPVPYSAIAKLFELVEEEPKRLKIMSLVSDFFRSVIALTPRDLLPCVYLACNKIAPAYDGSELGIGDAILLKALAEATGGTLAKMKIQLKETGDLGSVALTSRSKQRTMFQPQTLNCAGVFRSLKDIAAMAGKNTGSRKVDVIKRLLVACRGEEAKFLTRGLQGNLRIGLAEKGVISALARAITLTPPISVKAGKLIADSRKVLSEKELESAFALSLLNLNQAYTEVPCHDAVVQAILDYPIEELPQRCFLTPGIPVKVMLGKPCTGLEAILERFLDCLFTLEFKYDGERAQIHLLADGSIRIYSRNSENHTGKYPDLIARLPATYDADKVKTFIIDCEVVAWDLKEKRILPFQTLSTRKRKAVEDSEITVQVCLFGFDLIYLNGVSYLNEPFLTRRQTLWDNFRAIEGEFAFAEHRDTSDIEEIDAFLKLAVSSSCEGLMVKSLDKDALYVPNKRNWLKVKKDYLAGAGDSFDLVPIAGWYGSGKRTGVYGAYLLACYDEESEEYQCITKIGTGFSDAELESHSKALNEHLINEQPRYVRIPDSLKPDVYFAPAIVWEVKCADLSISPLHLAAAGKVHETKGIALRFPRFLRIRDDKKPEDATSAEQVVDMYQNQSVVMANSKGNNKMDME